MKPMKLKIGPYVSGKEHFFPRPDVIKRLQKNLKRGHISFLAPRRTGKTSILKHLEEHSAENHPHFFINLETSTTPAEMIAQMISPLHEENPRWKKALNGLGGKVRNLVGSVESLSVAGQGIKLRPTDKDWQTPAAQFLKLLQEHDGPLTFLLDEFPILVNNAAKADREGCEQMLRWFREWRQRTSETQVRFLVTGSIGLDGVVRRHRLSDTVNDFDSVDLPALSEEQAHEFVKAFVGGCEMEIAEPEIQQLLDLLGNSYPYFLQIFIDELDTAIPENTERTITGELLNKVYVERMVPSHRNKYLKHMWNRLDDVFTQGECRIARSILKAVAHTNDGLLPDLITEAARSGLPDSSELDPVDLNYIVDVLKHDGYLQQDFESPFHTRYFTHLLRDNFLRRYV
jgi:hypothetical protein